MMTENRSEKNKPELKSVQINVRITPALKKRFAEAAASQGHTITDALITLITQYCERAEGER